MLPVLADAVGVIRTAFFFLNLINKLYHIEPHNWAAAGVVLRAIWIHSSWRDIMWQDMKYEIAVRNDVLALSCHAKIT